MQIQSSICNISYTQYISLYRQRELARVLIPIINPLTQYQSHPQLHSSPLPDQSHHNEQSMPPFSIEYLSAWFPCVAQFSQHHTEQTLLLTPTPTKSCSCHAVPLCPHAREGERVIPITNFVFLMCHSLFYPCLIAPQSLPTYSIPDR